MAWTLGFPIWSLVKLGVVALIAAHYVWTGRLVIRAKAGRFEESDFYLRVFNEISVIAVIGVLWLVVTRPF
jgi:putative membrane protein